MKIKTDNNQIRYSEGYSKDSKLKIHWSLYETAYPQGTVFLIHGYLNHSIIWDKYTRELNTLNFNAALIDLPGHGKSAGPRGEIEYFSDYGQSINLTIDTLRDLPRPWIFLGHSTGCAAISEYLKLKPDKLPEKIIFLAPLIRPAYSWLNKLFLYLIPVNIRSIPRKIKNCSHNNKFIIRLKNDPLELKEISLSWVKKMFIWSKKQAERINSSIPLLLIQGTADSTIDWRYSLKTIPLQYKRTIIKIIKNGRHHLINESSSYRNQVTSAISNFITGNSP